MVLIPLALYFDSTMCSIPVLVKVAQSAAGNGLFLATICGAYTEVGKNQLEQAILDHLNGQASGQVNLEGCDIVSDLFTVFG